MSDSLNPESSGERTVIKRVSDREIAVTRSFDAPARIVFAAWTQAELFKRWWAPKSLGFPLRSCDLDVRTGGSYRLEFGKDGEEVLPSSANIPRSCPINASSGPMTKAKMAVLPPSLSSKRAARPTSLSAKPIPARKRSKPPSAVSTARQNNSRSLMSCWWSWSPRKPESPRKWQQGDTEYLPINAPSHPAQARDGFVTQKNQSDDGRSALIVLPPPPPLVHERIADMDPAIGALNELLLKQFRQRNMGSFRNCWGGWSMCRKCKRAGRDSGRPLSTPLRSITRIYLLRKTESICADGGTYDRFSSA